VFWPHITRQGLHTLLILRGIYKLLGRGGELIDDWIELPESMISYTQRSTDMRAVGKF
jgi:hypothetical protein